MATYLVDFENVRSDDLSNVVRLSASDRVILFYSEKADKISIGLHRRILESKAIFEYRKADVGAKDALDFQLVTYLGYLIATNGAEKYCIVSNDQGFEYAANFWRKQKYFVRQMSAIIPLTSEKPQEPVSSLEPSAAEEAEAQPAKAVAAQDPVAITADPIPGQAPQPETEASEPSQEPESAVSAEAVSPEAAIPELSVDDTDPVGEAAPKPQHTRTNRRSSRPVHPPVPRKPVEPAAGEEKALTEEEMAKLKASVTEALGEDAETDTVADYILKYKSKLGINNALVKKYGNQKGGEIYKKIKCLIADKKGH